MVICKKAAAICQEWADDFRQQGMTEDTRLWEALALVFSTGSEIDGGGKIPQAIRATTSKAQLPERLITMMPAKEQQALREIREEAQYLLPKLNSLRTGVV